MARLRKIFEIEGMERTRGEAADKGVTMADGAFLETVFVLSEAGHKKLVGEMLARAGG